MDYGRVRQMISNIINNAIKFTFKGHVKVKVQLKSGKPELLSFSVEDTGIGMDEYTMETIFKPFSQADMSYTRTFGGVGLGLATSYHLASLLGGHIAVSSSQGVGSTFVVEIPFIPGKAKTRELVQDGMVNGTVKKMKEKFILVVEDNSMNQKFVLRTLEKMGFKATGADNGAEALRLIHMFPEKYALVLMDCSMPVMDGYEATENIRRLPEPMSSLPIVAMTANVMQGERERCIRVGMNDYLEKPLNRNQLQKILDRYLRESSVG